MEELPLAGSRTRRKRLIAEIRLPDTRAERPRRGQALALDGIARVAEFPAMVLIDIRGEARGRFCSAWLSTMGLVSADEQPQSCADARPAEIGRHDHFDRFRQDVELTQTRQGPARHIVRFG